jgi:hypothetical protein
VVKPAGTGEEMRFRAVEPALGEQGGLLRAAAEQDGKDEPVRAAIEERNRVRRVG